MKYFYQSNVAVFEFLAFHFVLIWHSFVAGIQFKSDLFDRIKRVLVTWKKYTRVSFIIFCKDVMFILKHNYFPNPPFN